MKFKDIAEDFVKFVGNDKILAFNTGATEKLIINR